jgi:hypothetical protein
MIDALRVARYGLKDLWEEFVWLVVLNLLWSLTMALPLVPLLVLENLSLGWGVGVTLLLALPLPIVTGALCFVTNQVSRGKIAGWGMFVVGLRRYWAKSLTVALINLVILVLIGANLQFYGVVLQGTWTNFALSAWLVVALYWLLTQIFWFPMILELENEKVLLALRNALAMVLITPGFSATLGALMLVLAGLCIVLSIPLVIMMASLLLLIANHATRSRLAFVQKKPYTPIPDED